jgi:hypothetical protein
MLERIGALANDPLPGAAATGSAIGGTWNCLPQSEQIASWAAELASTPTRPSQCGHEIAVNIRKAPGRKRGSDRGERSRHAIRKLGLILGC